MSSNNRPLKFEVRLPREHPQLLQGLDAWLDLNLISDAQVRRICQENLVCQIALQTQTTPQRENKTVVSPSSKSVNQLPEKVNTAPSFFSRIWQSLIAEFSVSWLLFLGMFTVIVSSAALAASQWERFTPFLQYGILLTYTLIFCGLSLLTGKQANLRLTSSALHLVTMLLVPVNFWAMDSFNLLLSPSNWILVGISAIILTGITILISKKSIFVRNVRLSKLSLVNLLILSYLHWGWKFSGFPVISVYLAVIGTTLVTVFQVLKSGRKEDSENSILTQISWFKNAPANVIIYASMLLLLRAIFVVGVNIENLGLAIGIYGWLVAWLTQREVKQTRSLLPLQAIAGVLLFIGWATTFSNNPGQAIVVSGLGLWFFNNRLDLYGLRADLTALFLIGLQSVWLSWRLLPIDLQTAISKTTIQLTNSQNHPGAILSLGFFPYIIWMVAFTDRLYRKNKPELASFGEVLTLVLGLNLTAVALINPALRSLNLLLSSITLVIVPNSVRVRD